MNALSLNLETIRLQLIDNPQFQPHDLAFSSREAIQYLIKALEHADKAFSQDIEDLLTRMGHQAVSYLLDGLFADDLNVKSTCAMVLVRLGRSVGDSLRQRRESAGVDNWAADFVLEQLGLASMPAPHALAVAV